MTDKELQAIEARADAATGECWKPFVEEGRLLIRPTVGEPGDMVAEVFTDGDAAFICGAREDIPKLIAEVRKFKAYIKMVTWAEIEAYRRRLPFGDNYK